MAVVAFNGNTSAGAMLYLEAMIAARQSPHVLMMPEAHVRGEAAAELQRRAARAGYRALVAPALPGVGQSTRGGVALLARANLCMGRPFSAPTEVLVPGHLVAGHVQAFCRGGVTLLGVYLVVGVGLAHENVNILRRAARVAAAAGGQWLMAGDFNLAPAELEQYALALGGR
eukprot:9369099-Lingulodinium_polyedra.AAC.1